MGGVSVLTKTQRIVVSSQQRIVVTPDREVDVLRSQGMIQIIPAGPPGPRGYKGDAGESGVPPSGVSGVVLIPGTVWIMNHGLDYRPAAYRFFDDNDEEIEPEDIVYINEDREVAIWPEPMSGTWTAS